MINQMRVKFSGVEGIEGETSRSRDRKLQSQKTRSFKEDNRRSRTWYRGQSSGEQRYDYNSDYMESDEFQTAVAAAAFAINSVEERTTRRQREDSLSKSAKPRRKPEDGAVSLTRRAREKMFSSSPSNKMKNKEDDTVHVSTPSLPSKKSPELQEKVPNKATSPANTVLKDEVAREIETGHQQPPTEVRRKRSESRPEDIKADVWEKTEMERVKERYEKLNAKILEWEDEKKAKAKKTLSRNKDESGKKRTRALQKYKTEMEMIDQIVEGARSQAEENQRKEVIKVKEKAAMIRSTGKIPTKTCFCF